MEHSGSFIKLVNEAKAKIREVRINDVLKMLTDQVAFTFIDVREDDEWRAGRAKGAIHVGRGVIERDIENLVPNKNQKLVLYCGGGFRSALAAENLQRMGYTDVISMDGGIRAWRDANLPEEKG